MTDTEAAIVLNMLPQVGPVRVRRLTGRFGSLSAILEARGSALRTVEGIGPEVSSSITGWREHADLDAETALVQKAGVRILTTADPEYPELLKEIHDPPILLYILGALEERDRRGGIGIVGTRRASHYASESAKKLGYQLAYSGLTIYSGLNRPMRTLLNLLGALQTSRQQVLGKESDIPKAKMNFRPISRAVRRPNLQQQESERQICDSAFAIRLRIWYFCRPLFADQ